MFAIVKDDDALDSRQPECVHILGEIGVDFRRKVGAVVTVQRGLDVEPSVWSVNTNDPGRGRLPLPVEFESMLNRDDAIVQADQTRDISTREEKGRLRNHFPASV